MRESSSEGVKRRVGKVAVVLILVAIIVISALFVTAGAVVIVPAGTR